jgi:hypothetical protein
MKTFATLTVASLMALASAAAVAQTAPSAPDANAPSDQRRPVTSRADFDALTDARVASIQAGLKLTPEQQALWPAVEQGIRAVAAERAERWERRGERRNEPRQDLSFMDRIERQSDSATRYAEPLRALSTALRPLWATLDDRQKRLLPVLMRPTTEMAARRADMRERRADRMDDHRGMMGRGGRMEHHGRGGPHHN